MHPMLNIAVRAARNAGKVIAKSYEQLDLVQAELKGSNDFVTNVDKEAEQAIISTIQASYPDHSFVAEESGVTEGKDTKFQWIIDPLDGTTNFVKGIPHFAVSIALKVDGKLDLAYVAAGRVEGFWEIGLKPWDTAAGQLIAREAGAVIADFEGGDKYDQSGNIVVATPKILGAMLKIIRPHLNDGLRSR